jgi:hypothetical protein
MMGPTMEISLARKAFERGKVLAVRYHGADRDVEVHAVGHVAGHNTMLCWQVRGGSRKQQPVGWRNLRLADIETAAITDEPSRAPRPGYNGGGKAMTTVFFELEKPGRKPRVQRKAGPDLPR